jgi:hypothetical protein
MSESGLNGSSILQASKRGVESAREVSPVGYKSVPGAENSFAPSLVGDAIVAGNREAALRGMVPQSSLPPEEYEGSPAVYTCQQCGRRTCYQGLCTSCLEDWGRREERKAGLV